MDSNTWALSVIRATRAEPPGRAGSDPDRRATYGAALQQFDELLAAAAVAGHASRPLPLFYALSQAGAPSLPPAARRGRSWRRSTAIGAVSAACRRWYSAYAASGKARALASAQDSLARSSGRRAAGRARSARHACSPLRPVATARFQRDRKTDRSAPRCGPFAVPIPANSREHERTASPEAQRFRGFSPVFACLRGSLTNGRGGFRTCDLSRVKRALSH